MNGVVSFLADPTTNVVTGPQFVAYLKAMGVTHVKAPVRTGASGNLPTSRYVQAVQAHQQAGIAVLPLFDRAFRPTSGESHTIYPNMPLNTTGDRLLSPWINGFTLRGQGFLRQLCARAGVRRAVVWNEANGLALLAPGTNPDPSGLKANALSPEVFGALCWQAATRWKVAGIRQVYCAALSLLPQGGTDAGNPYGGGYIDRWYRSLEAHAKHAPWPWAGICVNSEGYWSAEHFATAIGTIRKVMTAHGDTGEIIVGEWGVTNADVRSHPDQAAPTYASITGVCPENYFFSGPGHEPYLGPVDGYGSYGAFRWENAGTAFQAGGDYAWGPVLRQLFR